MAKFCRNCGKELKPGIAFCTECGAKIPEETKPEPAAVPEPVTAPPEPIPVKTPAPVPKPAPAPVYAQAPKPAEKPEEEAPPKGSQYEPISTGGYVGILLLLCIPVVGFVLAIIWACGGCTKINKRNLSRAYLIFMAVSLVISLIMGIIFGITAAAATAGAVNSIFAEETSPAEEEESFFSGLADIFGGGENSEANQNEDLEALNELEKIFDELEGITGEENGYGDLIDGAQKANEDAEAANNGWPKELPEYPYGTAEAVASYRTEISGTTLDEMHAFIDSLKAEGYVYKDFYEFGMTEEDMLGMDGWWGTNGKVYVSISYYEGVVTVDHTYELPNLEDYFG